MQDTTVAVVAMTDGERPYARAAIASVLRQTRRPEVVRVYVEHRNEWIQSLADELPGFEIVRIALQPAGAVRNLAAADAETRWLAYLDGDDVWLDTKHERQLALAESSGATLIGCDYTLIDATAKRRVAALCRHLPCPSSWLIRREAMLERPFDRAWLLCEDSEWWQHYRAWTFTARLAEPLHDYRVRASSQSSGTPSKARKLRVLRWAGAPLVGGVVRAAALALYRAHRSDRYPALAAFREGDDGVMRDGVLPR